MAYNDVRTPEQHAAATGNSTLDPRTDEIEYSAGHLAAAQLHGWEAHKKATTEAFTLLEGYYLEAITAALSGSVPYASALSPYAISGTVPPIGPGKHLVEADAEQPWVTFEDLELPASSTQVFDYIVRAFGYLESTPTTRVNETAFVRVTRDGSGNASLLSVAAPFSDSRLRVTVGTDDITVDVRAHASQDWVWDTEAVRQTTDRSISILLPSGATAATSVRKRGAAASSGVGDLDGVSLGTGAAPTTLTGGSGVNTLYTYSPAVSTQTELVAQLRISAGSGGRCVGSISAIVSRGASGAPSITPAGGGNQSISGNWVNTYAAFAPQFVVDGNDIKLQVTAHTSNATFVRGSLSIDPEDTSGDVDPLDTLYADTLAILAANGGFLINGDNVTSAGGRISAFTDQAGNYTCTVQVGDTGGVLSTLGAVPACDVEATGETARYQLARTAGASTTQEWSLFAVWYPETNNTDTIFFNCDTSPTRSLCTRYVASIGSNGPCIAGSGTNYTSGTTLTIAAHVLEFAIESATRYVLLDGVATGTPTANTPANLGQNFTLNHNSTKLDGKWGDIILVEDKPTAGERSTIMSYLQTKYAAVL